MKKIINPWLAILIFMAFLFAACNKPDKEPGSPKITNNTAPVANAGKDTTIIFPVTSVFLDGSASTDKEDNIFSYRWRQISLPFDFDRIQNKNSAKALVEYLENNTCQFELTVTDHGGLSSKDTIQVSAVLPPPMPGIKAGDDITISLPYNRVILETFFKAPENTTKFIRFNWQEINGSKYFLINDPNSPSTIVSQLDEGTFKFEITIDHWNQLTEKDTIAVTVLPDANIYTAEKIFEKRVWVDDYPISSITINNISSVVAAGQQFKVYLKVDANAEWQFVCTQLNDPYNLYAYHYTNDNNELTVFINYDDPSGWGGDEFGKYYLQPAIKIVY